MCRCKGEHSGGRRCPTDTQEARRLRLHKAKAIAKYTPLVISPHTRQETLPVDETETNPSMEDQVDLGIVREQIKHLNFLVSQDKYWGSPAGIPNIRDWLLEIDETLIKVGSGVERLAETKYGAPTDAVLSELTENNDRAKIAIADEYDKKILPLREKKDIKRKEYLEKLDVYNNRFDTELGSRGFTSETYPIMNERYKEFEKQYPEVWDSLNEQAMEVEKLITEYHDMEKTIAGLKEEKYEKIAALKVSYDTGLGEKFQARNEAIKKALTELGVGFASANDLKVSDNSHKKAMKSVNAVLHYYPKEWVDNSNTKFVRELRVKDSVGRAHYSNGRIQKTRSTSLKYYVVELDENWKPDPHDQNDSEYIPIADGEWVDPKGKSNILSSSVDTPGAGQKQWVKMEYEYVKWQGAGDPPETMKGYPEKRQFWEEKWDHEARKFYRTGKMETYYRKPRTVTRTSMASIQAELLVSPSPQSPTNTTANTSVAIHELAHRMEATNPTILQMERAFLLRRAGILGPNPEKLTTIYQGKNEKGYKDEFINHYMGKVYGGDYYEILSTGMETLFEGRFGGFVGMDGEKRDPDHKRAILGILASAAQKQ